MSNSGNFAEKWNAMFRSIGNDEILPETQEQPKTGWRKVKEVLGVIGRVIFRLRKVFMAIPVVYYALKLASYNAANLPEMVGLNIQSNGVYAETISRAMAVNGPLMLTGGCLALMFLSRKTVYPWIISIFSLIVPIMLLITNIYPC